MSKKTIIILVILLSFAGALAFVFFNQDEAAAPATTTSSSTSQTASNEPTSPAASTEAGVYTEYSEAALAEANGTKVLFFHAPWCPQCRELDADITAKGVPAGTTILKVDYDTNQALRQKYGVTIQTTLVTVDDQGQLIKKYVAYDDPSLAAVQENLL